MIRRRRLTVISFVNNYMSQGSFSTTKFNEVNQKRDDAGLGGCIKSTIDATERSTLILGTDCTLDATRDLP